MTLTLFTSAAIFGFAYLFQAVFGFGAALIAVVVASAILPVQSVVAMVPLTVLVAGLLTVLTDYRTVRLKEVGPIVLKAMPGVVMGALMLGRVSGIVIITIVCLAVIAYSAGSLHGNTVRVSPSAEIPLASAAGFAIAITGFGILFVPLVMGHLEDPREFRTSMNAVWLLLGVIRVPIYVAAGLVTDEVLVGTLWTVPAILLSLGVGSRIARRIDPTLFRRAGFVFLGILAVLRLALVAAGK